MSMRCRGFDPYQRPASDSKSSENAGSEQVTPDTTPPLDGTEEGRDENSRPAAAAAQRSRSLSRTTPGSGDPEPGAAAAAGERFRSPGAVWRRQQSPGVNLLALLQSPHPPAKSDLFMSPGLKVLHNSFHAVHRCLLRRLQICSSADLEAAALLHLVPCIL